MASFVEDKKIKQDFKRKLVGAVLNGYLSLRRSVIRTVFFRVSTCSFLSRNIIFTIFNLDWLYNGQSWLIKVRKFYWIFWVNSLQVCLCSIFGQNSLLDISLILFKSFRNRVWNERLHGHLCWYIKQVCVSDFKFFKRDRSLQRDILSFRYEVDDLRTPVFIFERLCNIIYPVSVPLWLSQWRITTLLKCSLCYRKRMTRVNSFSCWKKILNRKTSFKVVCKETRISKCRVIHPVTQLWIFLMFTNMFIVGLLIPGWVRWWEMWRTRYARIVIWLLCLKTTREWRWMSLLLTILVFVFSPFLNLLFIISFLSTLKSSVWIYLSKKCTRRSGVHKERWGLHF